MSSRTDETRPPRPLPGGEVIDLDGRKNVAVDANQQSSVSKVFAAGDAHMGASLVVRAIASGRKAAEEIDRSRAPAPPRGADTAEPPASGRSLRSGGPDARDREQPQGAGQDALRPALLYRFPGSGTGGLADGGYHRSLRGGGRSRGLHFGCETAAFSYS